MNIVRISGKIVFGAHRNSKQTLLAGAKGSYSDLSQHLLVHLSIPQRKLLPFPIPYIRNIKKFPVQWESLEGCLFLEMLNKLVKGRTFIIYELPQSL